MYIIISWIKTIKSNPKVFLYFALPKWEINLDQHIEFFN